MAGATVRLNRAGLREILKDKSTERAALRRAEAIARACGRGYKATSVIGKNRARASVITDSFAARVDNSRRNTLVRNVGAGRGRIG